MTTIESVTKRVDRLEAGQEQEKKEKEQLRNRVDELESENDDLRRTVETQAQEINELRDELSNITTHSGKERAELAGRITKIEETIEKVGLVDANPTPKEEKTTVQQADLTHIEQMSRVAGDNISSITDSVDDRRAIALFRNLIQWGKKTPKGYCLRPADNPVSLLEADQDESLCWKQYYRACKALESLSEGAVTFCHSDRQGKILILHQQSEVYDRVTNTSLSASSVGAKG